MGEKIGYLVFGKIDVPIGEFDYRLVPNGTDAGILLSLPEGVTVEQKANSQTYVLPPATLLANTSAGRYKPMGGLPQELAPGNYLLQLEGSLKLEFYATPLGISVPTPPDTAYIKGIGLFPLTLSKRIRISSGAGSPTYAVGGAVSTTPFGTGRLTPTATSGVPGTANIFREVAEDFSIYNAGVLISSNFSEEELITLIGEAGTVPEALKIIAGSPLILGDLNSIIAEVKGWNYSYNDLVRCPLEISEWHATTAYLNDLIPINEGNRMGYRKNLDNILSYKAIFTRANTRNVRIDWEDYRMQKGMGGYYKGALLKVGEPDYEPVHLDPCGSQQQAQEILERLYSSRLKGQIRILFTSHWEVGFLKPGDTIALCIPETEINPRVLSGGSQSNINNINKPVASAEIAIDSGAALGQLKVINSSGNTITVQQSQLIDSLEIGDIVVTPSNKFHFITDIDFAANNITLDGAPGGLKSQAVTVFLKEEQRLFYHMNKSGIVTQAACIPKWNKQGIINVLGGSKVENGSAVIVGEPSIKFQVDSCIYTFDSIAGTSRQTNLDTINYVISATSV
jgi:hypothetical protein